MESDFTSHYLVLVMIGATSIVQVAAVRNGLAGILFARRWPRATEIIAAAAIVSVFIWFFLASGERNVPDSVTGLDGVTQGRLFATGAGIAIAATFALTSIINERWARTSGATDGNGLDALRTTTFARAVLASLRLGERSS